MNELICVPTIEPEIVVDRIKLLSDIAIVCTKNQRSYSFDLVSSTSHVDDVSVAELNRQAEKIVLFLRKTLPKKLYRAVYMQIANEVSKVKWREKQKKREKAQKRASKTKEEPVSWKDTIPDSFSGV